MGHNLKTPYFIIHKNKLIELLGSLKEALLTYYPKGIIGYSFKTNNLPWVIHFMKENSIFAEVVSSDEFHLAKELGYKESKIIFNGPAKNKEEFIEAISKGAIVNIDTKRELDWLLECNNIVLSKSRIGIRVNYCIEDFCPGESQCGLEDGRFGFSYETGEVKKIIDFFRKNNITLAGLHLHCSSKTRSLNIYKSIANIASEIVSKYDLHLEYIDIGGGFFGGVEGKPSFKEYISNVYEILNKNELLKDVNLIIEPGMCLIGASMDYVTSVVDTKKTKNNNFAVLDGSRIHIDPLMRKNSYTYRLIRKNYDEKAKETEQILCGFTCMEGDRFFTHNGQSLNINDEVIFEKVGAYTIGLAPQFIEFHPDIYVLDNENITLVQSRRIAKEFIKDI